ncbi:hypothetical protein UT300019_33210 [Clostridium sp. CTA-19]
MKGYKPLGITFILCILIFFATGWSFLKNNDSDISSLVIHSLGIHSLGCIEKDDAVNATGNRVISIELKKGDKVKFTYDSDVKKGSLKIQLTGSKNEVIEDFPINTSGAKELTMDKDVSGDLSVELENFVGSYKIYGDEIK